MLYPLTFKPILKSVIWGGSEICPFKGISPVQEGIGESWELSHVDGDYSIVAEGELANKSLDDLIKAYGKDLLGAHVMDMLTWLAGPVASVYTKNQTAYATQERAVR